MLDIFLKFFLNDMVCYHRLDTPKIKSILGIENDDLIIELYILFHHSFDERYCNDFCCFDDVDEADLTTALKEYDFNFEDFFNYIKDDVKEEHIQFILQKILSKKDIFYYNFLKYIGFD